MVYSFYQKSYRLFLCNNTVKNNRLIKLLVYGVTSNELPLTIEDESSLIASEEDLKSNKQQKLR
ncbi:hypothetical protein BLA29_011153, partial [Euroglyphus maynei]